MKQHNVFHLDHLTKKTDRLYKKETLSRDSE